MDRHRHQLLSAVITVAAASLAGACGGPVTTRPTSRALAATPARSLVVAISSPSPHQAQTRILDENAVVVADVPDSMHAVFEVPSGEHVFSSFVGGMPTHAACVGALHATLAPGRTYAFRIEISEGPSEQRECEGVELRAVKGAEIIGVVAKLRAEERRELLPAGERRSTVGDDLDLREAVVGLAKLRIQGDPPTFGPNNALTLPGGIKLELLPPPRWSPAVSTLAEDDGVTMQAP